MRGKRRWRCGGGDGCGSEAIPHLVRVRVRVRVRVTVRARG